MSLSQRLRLDGKVAFIAGGAGGIGAAVAESCIELGATVVLGDKDAGQLTATAGKLGSDSRVNTVELDVTTRRSVDG
ncbi:SDR family NAD(P)-dependent oxidoreductase [Rhizobium sp. BK456]|uniref:SDR family NAD(P)-dependent oxidoreductase n=1 Tax=Rhizobium sp. BK456 TaxID=2587007 RepID=UPI00161BB926|nr:SDR family NAD(P)-dependent oxidoreductase [Rhizobium sp. BK456]MBB3526973.1 NADP-dependent 3-hydroxy acid dehydrogenase YdfG [Rhizobium sp. BK456]